MIQLIDVYPIKNWSNDTWIWFRNTKYSTAM